jgi:anti-sigma factor RsiW
MNQDLNIKLQALLDGELPEREAAELRQLLERDAEARDLVSELRATQAALKDFESDLKVPESREFYWSKIQREINRREAPARPAPAVSWVHTLRRWLVPVSSVAVIAIVGLVSLLQSPLMHSPVPGASEVAMTEANAFTYRDFNSGTTLVWLDYPAENELAPNATADTLD